MVSVIIVNYHTLGQIADCIASVREKTSGVEYEIIVVDNASEPDFSATCLRMFGPDVRAIALPENVGFGRANNAGFAAARGDILFCLNPDTLLHNNAIKILADYLASHPRVGACGGNLVHADGGRAVSFRRILPGLFWEISERLNLNPERIVYGRDIRFNRSGRPKQVGYISGADLMLRREVVEQTGGFAPEFFMYFEETDLCARIRRLGWKIMSVPEARICHLEGESFKSSAAEQRKLQMYRKSKELYMRRNCSRLTRRLCRLIGK